MIGLRVANLLLTVDLETILDPCVTFMTRNLARAQRRLDVVTDVLRITEPANRPRSKIIVSSLLVSSLEYYHQI